MISKRIFSIAQTIVICCLIGTFVTPLLLDPATIFPFIILKSVLFRLLTTILFITTLILLISARTISNFWKKTISRNIVLIFLLIFLITIILSMFFGVDAYNSFFSGGERMDGVITWIYFFLFLVSTLTLILITKKPLEQLNKCLKTNTVISCLVGITALISYKTGFLLESFKGARLVGVSGNPAYLASYMLLSIFLSLYLFFDNKSKKSEINWLYFGAFIWQSLILFGTGTRGAMVGWLAGGLLMLIYFSVAHFKERIGKLSLAIIVIGIMLIFSIFLLRNTELVKKNIGLSRLVSIINFKTDITAQSRVYSYKTALISWKEKPIFGWGLENYKLAFLPHILPGMVENNPQDITFDKTHNMPLEILVTTGILGFGAYMGIFVAIGIVLKRLYKVKTEDNLKIQVIILASGLLGYFVTNLFLFDIFESYLLFALYCLLILILSLKNECCDNITYVSIAPYKIVLTSILTVASIWMLYIGTIRPYLDSRQFFTANQYLKAKNFEKSKEVIEKVLRHESLVTRTGLKNYLKAFLTTPGYLTDSKAIEVATLLDKEYQGLMTRHPNDIDIKSDHISLLVNSFYQTPVKLKEAEDEQVYLVSYAPNYLYYIDHLAFIYGLEGKYDLAQKEITVALSLTDKMPEPYWYQGIIYSMAGNPLSIDFLYKGLKLGYTADMDEISKTVDLALKYENYSYLPDLYSLAIVLDPNNTQLYASLSAVYQKMGDYDNARKTAQKLLELDPSFKPQVDAFLKILPTN